MPKVRGGYPESPEVTVCEHCGAESGVPSRSSAANRYYWGVVIKLMAAHLGERPNELHEALKRHFRSREDITTGLTFTRSTKTGSDDFWDYVDQVRHWSHTFLGLYIPEPNEEWRAA